MPGVVTSAGTIVGILLKAGVPADSDFAVTPPNGSLALNTSTRILYVRSAGSWVQVVGGV